MKRTFLLVFSLAFFFQAHAQSKNDEKLIAEADEQFEKKLFHQALQSYKQVEDDGPEVARKIAKCYTGIFDYSHAEQAYESAYDASSSSADYALEYSKMIVYNGDYEKAIEILEQTSSLENNNKASKLIDAHRWASENSEPLYEIVATNIKTGGRSMGIALYKDGAIFSVPQQNDEDKRVFYDLAYAKMKDSASFDKPEVLFKKYSNTFYDGSPSVDEDGTLYFTSNASDKSKFKPGKNEKTNISEDGVNVLNIFKTKMEGGEWLSPEKLNINTNDYNSTHPFITSDGKHLYFVSDKPGGNGKLDIYVSSKEGSAWSDPENIGNTINTDAHEMYPYFRNDTLYFSSYGHKSYGGSDVFYSVKRGGSWSDPVNMGAGVNSNRDDFGIVLNKEGVSGYVSSNRGNGKSSDLIYYFEKVENDVVADTFLISATDKFSQKPIDNVKVQYESLTPVNDEIHESSLETDDKGEALIPVYGETEYVMTLSKDGYYDKEVKVDENTGADEINELLSKIEMDPKAGKDEVITLNEIYFEYDRAALQASSLPILDRLIEYMKSNPSVKIELSAHTDSRASSSYNKKLSQARAEMCRKYLLLEDIDASRIVAAGYGESKLVNGCKDGVECSEEQHQENRRVEVKFL